MKKDKPVMFGKFLVEAIEKFEEGFKKMSPEDGIYSTEYNFFISELFEKTTTNQYSFLLLKKELAETLLQQSFEKGVNAAIGCFHMRISDIIWEN